MLSAVVPIRILLGTTVVRIRILIRTTIVRTATSLYLSSALSCMTQLAEESEKDVFALQSNHIVVKRSWLPVLVKAANLITSGLRESSSRNIIHQTNWYLFCPLLQMVRFKKETECIYVKCIKLYIWWSTFHYRLFIRVIITFLSHCEVC